MPTLAQCAKEVLCGLSANVQAKIKGLIQTYISVLDAEITSLEAQLVYLDLLTAPIQIARDLANEAVAEIREGASLIPISLIERCTDINVLTEAITRNLDTALEDFNNLTIDLQRLLSFRDEVQAIVDDLRETRDFYVEVLDNFTLCDALA